MQTDTEQERVLSESQLADILRDHFDEAVAIAARHLGNIDQRTDEAEDCVIVAWEALLEQARRQPVVLSRFSAGLKFHIKQAVIQRWRTRNALKRREDMRSEFPAELVGIAVAPWDDDQIPAGSIDQQIRDVYMQEITRGTRVASDVISVIRRRDMRRSIRLLPTRCAA